MFALCDCNNFYASCERLFRPDLESRPVAVLSNNDGCVIARSAEVKALGVPMGAPYFKEEGRFRHFGVEVFSSNFPLYEDLSRRVSDALRSMAPDVEIYSIDEAFLASTPCRRASTPRDSAAASAEGPPVDGDTRIDRPGSHQDASQGGQQDSQEGPSRRRLRHARRRGDDPHLEGIDIGYTWGIGLRNAPKLRRFGIGTARGLKYADEEWLKKRFSISEARTSRELNGQVCHPFTERVKPRKTIRVSRSFGNPVMDLHSLREAVSSFAFSAAETLRKQGSAAGKMHLFLMTNPFGEGPGYAAGATERFDVPASGTVEIVGRAVKCLEGIFVEGPAYKKAGVILTDLADAACLQRHLFTPMRDPREGALMGVMDRLNRELGNGTVFTASMGIHGRRSWVMRQGACRRAIRPVGRKSPPCSPGGGAMMNDPRSATGFPPADPFREDPWT